MNQNRVSAILPIKNGAKYIANTLPQILDNLEQEDELVIVDDSSTDNSLELANSFIEVDSRVKVMENPGNGIVDALNHGLKNSRFEIVARFDIDDYYFINRIREQKQFLRKGVVAVFCDYQVIDSDSKDLGIIHSPVLAISTRLSLSKNQRTPHPGVIYLKTPCMAVGGYRKGDEGVEDLSLWLRMSKVGDLVSVPKVLFCYRIHTGSVTISKRREIVRKQQKIITEFPISSEELKSIRNSLREVIEVYKSLPDSYPRILLFLREFWLIGTKKDRIGSTIQCFWQLRSLNPFKIVHTLIKLTLESKKRQSARLR